jgi:hypothetical protein
MENSTNSVGVEIEMALAAIFVVSPTIVTTHIPHAEQEAINGKQGYSLLALWMYTRSRAYSYSQLLQHSLSSGST